MGRALRQGQRLGHGHVIEPAGLPAVKMKPLSRRALDRLSDEDMVTLQRANLIDPAASPNPSVETLLHAFLPHKFVDHTHSTAILAIADQAKASKLSAKCSARRWACTLYHAGLRARQGGRRSVRQDRRSRA
jgi:rhamnose utilization protein RhaD (predicted bifunctional aldolase and dehydrogenase)